MKFSSAVALTAFAASLLTMAPSLAGPQASGRVNRQSLIETQALCGTWQSVASSGGFHQITTDGSHLKHFGLDKDGDAVQVVIKDVGPRTVLANEMINLEEKQRFHIRDGFVSQTTRTLVGVTDANKILFAAKDEPNMEVWTKLDSGLFDVTGVETGAHAMSYHYQLKQVSKAACQ
jgi:hypothetical protein